MRNELAQAIAQKASEDKDFFLIVGDAGLGLFDEYQKVYQDQYLNAGINEAASVGMAAGMALMGKKVVYYNLAPFTIMRPYEQVRNDICYQELPVILIGIGSSLTYAPSGMTHYSIEDIALALTMPNLDIFSPCDSKEARAAFDYAYASKNPSYIRVPKASKENFNKNEVINILKPQILRQGEKILLISHSEIVSEAMKASVELNASVVSMPFINSSDNDIIKLARDYEYIFVLEENFAFGALGTLLKEKLDRKIYQIAIPNQYIHLIANQEEMKKHFRLDCESIIHTIKRALKDQNCFNF